MPAPWMVFDLFSIHLRSRICKGKGNVLFFLDGVKLWRHCHHHYPSLSPSFLHRRHCHNCHHHHHCRYHHNHHSRSCCHHHRFAPCFITSLAVTLPRSPSPS